MSAVVIGKFKYLSSTYYVWKETGRKDNLKPFYFGLTKDRNDVAPNCAYSSIASLLSTHAMHRVTINYT
jgi:hypothetical protein